MLAVKTYSRTYVDTAERNFSALLEALPEGTPAEVCNHLALALDRYFLHRQRSVEGRDGNPLNELRMISDSVAECGGVLSPDATIDYRPEESVLGLSLGTQLALEREHLAKLAKSVFNEIRIRFT